MDRTHHNLYKSPDARLALFRYSIYLKKITWDTSKLNYPPPPILYSRIYFSQPPFLRFLVFTNKRRCVGVFSPTITEHDGKHKIIISFAPFSSQLRRLIELWTVIFFWQFMRWKVRTELQVQKSRKLAFMATILVSSEINSSHLTLMIFNVLCMIW